MTKAKKTDYYYYFMKAGHANCFLKYARQLNGLWVGYDGDNIPKIKNNGICSKGSEKADLRYMTASTHGTLRKEVRIVLFGKDNLQIFEPTAPLQYLKKTNAVDWADPKLYKSFPAKWHKLIKKNYGGIGSSKFFAQVFGKSGWKLIPAKLVTVIPRASLLAPIDSLSVWQSFNRRTFQPMFSSNSGSALEKINWLKTEASLTPLKISDNETLQETPFGKFVRLYLNSKISDDNQVFCNLSKDELTQTIFGILNPAQVETIALHLCRDINFTVDVGLGKGLDIADVKGTVRHLNATDRKNRTQAALKKLEFAGVNFSEKLRTNIEATASIRFQCKAKKTAVTDELGTVLLIQPGTQDAHKKDTLFLESLAKSKLDLFPTFQDWINVLQFDLTGQV